MGSVCSSVAHPYIIRPIRDWHHQVRYEGICRLLCFNALDALGWSFAYLSCDAFYQCPMVCGLRENRQGYAFFFAPGNRIETWEERQGFE